MQLVAQSSAPFWNKIAEKYARTPVSDVAAYEHTLRRAERHLSTSGNVLEIGCGTGTTALTLAPRVWHITATDIADKMLEVGQRKQAEQGIKNVAFQRAIDTDLPDGPFDTVMAFNLLHLTGDLDATLAEIHRVLRPGGLLISKTFCLPAQGGSLKFRMIRMALPIMQRLGRAPFVRFLSEEALDRAMIRAGFEIVEADSFPVQDPRRFLVLRKPAE